MNINKVLFVCIWFVASESLVQSNGQRFEEYYKWKQVSYIESTTAAGSASVLFPEIDLTNQYAAGNALSDFVPYNNVPMGANHYKGRMFITVPRRRPGVPSTLNFITTKSPKGSSPSLRPYPDVLTNALHPSLRADENRIISVYRTHIDVCKRLWFVDTGCLEYPNNLTQVQRPSIWIFDLERDQFISRFEIPESFAARGNGLASITVDVDANQCDNAYAYLPNLADYRLHVYSFAQDRMWTFNHNYFNFDPLRGDFNVAGLTYQWNDGIFSITLGRPNPDGYRTAYFHPMVSTSEFTVSTRVLRNETTASRSNHGQDFKFLGQRNENGQSAMHRYDELTGVLFYSQVATNGIACWNTNKPFTRENHAMIASDNERMIYPADVTIDSDGILWVLTNTMPRWIYARLNVNDFNFRVWRANIADIIRGTPCDSTRNRY